MKIKRFLFIGKYHLCYIHNTGWTNGRVGRSLSIMKKNKLEEGRWNTLITINF